MYNIIIYRYLHSILYSTAAQQSYNDDLQYNERALKSLQIYRHILCNALCITAISIVFIL